MQRSEPPEGVGAIEAWRRGRSFKADRYTLDGLLERKTGSISVVLPARNVGATIGGVVEPILRLKARGLIDELLVIDAGSSDATAEKARDLGAEVVAETSLFPHLGDSLGKGDAIWRGLAHTKGEIVAFFDTDTQNFSELFVLGLLGPLLEREDIQLVKARFHRPLKLGGATVEDEGGRVTELVARPLINMFFPALAGFVQPLAGEVAARRDLLERLSFPGGYGIEIAMLIDACKLVGIDALAEVDVGRREDDNQSLRHLTPMAYAVTSAILGRAGVDLSVVKEEGLTLAWPEKLEWRKVDTTERPPVRSLDRSPG